ncbi:MAG: PIG-L family deacetylase [Bryobacteraceae bacterium]|nr:PIG-L family deacetylase [Bryobacteraceae bacterium]
MRLIALLWLASAMLLGQSVPEDRGALGLHAAIQRLQTNARVLYIVAHPDDEDAGVLTMLARKHGAEVTLLSLTRGESGANLITGDTFDALGALRAAELSKAAEAYGVAVRFTRFADYGYSKNVAEAWRKWPREEVLRDVVWHVRDLKPHVILARFHGSPRDGHGQHTASGEIAKLAFEAAGDAARFPETGAAWEALRLFLNNWREPGPGLLRVDAGEYFGLLGRSFAQIGREGYRWHRSQAMGGAAARPGPVYSYYKLEVSRKAGDAPAGFLEALELETPTEIPFDPLRPEKSAAAIAALLLKEPDASRQARLRDALNKALGVELEIGNAGFAVATPGQRIALTARLHVRSGEAVMPAGITSAWPMAKTAAEDSYEVTVPASEASSAAFWTRDSIQEAQYRIGEWGLMRNALPPAPLRLRARYRYRGAESWVDARMPVAVGPALSLAFASPVGIGNGEYRTSVTVRNVGAGGRDGVVRLEAPAELRVEPAVRPFRFEREGEEARFEFTVKLPAAVKDYVLRAAAESGGQRYSSEFRPVQYQGIETVYLEKPAMHTVRVLDVKVAPGIKAGYVMGSGDAVPETMRQLGIPVDLLSTDEIARGDLSKYNLILLGIRAYATRPELKTHNARLLEYVREGGTLIVQYNTQEYDGNYGPYPYTMTMRAEEISEEDSPVRILAPENRVFQWPNKITAADFEGWVEQRGSKFFTTWDPAWTPLLETNDAGQAPQRGGWLEARYGKGLYVYCAYAWYRQLPYGVPGAVRLFANLVSASVPAGR